MESKTQKDEKSNQLERSLEEPCKTSTPKLSRLRCRAKNNVGQQSVDNLLSNMNHRRKHKSIVVDRDESDKPLGNITLNKKHLTLTKVSNDVRMLQKWPNRTNTKPHADILIDTTIAETTRKSLRFKNMDKLYYKSVGCLCLASENTQISVQKSKSRNNKMTDSINVRSKSKNTSSTINLESKLRCRAKKNVGIQSEDCHLSNITPIRKHKVLVDVHDESDKLLANFIIRKQHQTLTEESKDVRMLQTWPNRNSTKLHADILMDTTIAETTRKSIRFKDIEKLDYKLVDCSASEKTQIDVVKSKSRTDGINSQSKTKNTNSTTNLEYTSKLRCRTKKHVGHQSQDSLLCNRSLRRKHQVNDHNGSDEPLENIIARKKHPTLTEEVSMLQTRPNRNDTEPHADILMDTTIVETTRKSKSFKDMEKLNNNLVGCSDSLNTNSTTNLEYSSKLRCRTKKHVGHQSQDSLLCNRSLRRKHQVKVDDNDGSHEPLENIIARKKHLTPTEDVSMLQTWPNRNDTEPHADILMDTNIAETTRKSKSFKDMEKLNNKLVGCSDSLNTNSTTNLEYSSKLRCRIKKHVGHQSQDSLLCNRSLRRKHQVKVDYNDGSDEPLENIIARKKHLTPTEDVSMLQTWLNRNDTEPTHADILMDTNIAEKTKKSKRSFKDMEKLNNKLVGCSDSLNTNSTTNLEYSSKLRCRIKKHVGHQSQDSLLCNRSLRRKHPVKVDDNDGSHEPLENIIARKKHLTPTEDVSMLQTWPNRNDTEPHADILMDTTIAETTRKSKSLKDMEKLNNKLVYCSASENTQIDVEKSKSRNNEMTNSTNVMSKSKNTSSTTNLESTKKNQAKSTSKPILTHTDKRTYFLRNKLLTDNSSGDGIISNEHDVTTIDTRKNDDARKNIENKESGANKGGEIGRDNLRENGAGRTKSCAQGNHTDFASEVLCLGTKQTNHWNPIVLLNECDIVYISQATDKLCKNQSVQTGLLLAETENQSTSTFCKRLKKTPQRHLVTTGSVEFSEDNDEEIISNEVSSLSVLNMLGKGKSEKDGDVGRIMEGVVAYIDIRLDGTYKRRGVINSLTRLGSLVSKSLNRKVTHILFYEGSLSTVEKAQLWRIPLVSVEWVNACKTSHLLLSSEAFPPVHIEDYFDRIQQNKADAVTTELPVLIDHDGKFMPPPGFKPRAC
ncbi:hypothetical protein WDU94_008765 [Cyamophila willieti]